MWLALAGFVVLIVVSLVWGILGRAADQVTGIGVMLPSEGLYDLSSPNPGSSVGSPPATVTRSPPGRPS